MIRNIGAIHSKRPVHDNQWEGIRRDKEAAIKRWINDQLNQRSCTVVLIGEHTARCRWVRYEIQRSWELGKGLLGIRIHGLLDQHQQVSKLGQNPFDSIRLSNGDKLSSIIQVYDPPGETSAEIYSEISQQLEDWIETAIANRHASVMVNSDMSV